MHTHTELIQLIGSHKKAQQILNNQPKFIKEALAQSETFYNPRTNIYIERGLHSALIQVDSGQDGYYHSTMPYESSFYSECINLNQLAEAIAV